MPACSTAIASADNDLHFESMLVTRADLGRAIANQVTLRNIAACSDGLVNDTSGTAGYAFRLAQAGLGNRLLIKRTGAGLGIMHHKTLIVDAGASQSDPTVFVGSHNWTASADTENDENTLVVHDAQVTNRYYQEYAARIAEQTMPASPCAAWCWPPAPAPCRPAPCRPTPTPPVAASTCTWPAAGPHRYHRGARRHRPRSPDPDPALTGTDLTIDATALKAGPVPGAGDYPRGRANQPRGGGVI